MFWSPGFEEGGDARHIAIDGKTMRASKDSEGKAEHVLSAFCSSLQTVLGHEASRSKGLEIPDAFRLLERLDLTGRSSLGTRFSARNDRYERRRTQHDYPFQSRATEDAAPGHRNGFQRVGPPVLMERRCLKGAWPHRGARSTCCQPKPSGLKASGRRSGNPSRHTLAPSQKNGAWQLPQHEVVYLVSSLTAATSPQACWASTAIIGGSRSFTKEGRHPRRGRLPNRCDNAPPAVFSLTGFV